MNKERAAFGPLNGRPVLMKSVRGPLGGDLVIRGMHGAWRYDWIHRGFPRSGLIGLGLTRDEALEMLRGGTPAVLLARQREALKQARRDRAWMRKQPPVALRPDQVYAGQELLGKVAS